MTQGLGDFLFRLIGGEDCGEGTCCTTGAFPGFRLVLFCLQIKMKIK